MLQTTNEEAVTTNFLSIVVTSICQSFYILKELAKGSFGYIREFIQMGLFSAKCLSTARLDGKTAIITGCNTGIGKITAKDFFKRGARVIMACRNLKAANEAMDSIKEECANFQNCGEIRVEELDLSSLESVRICAKLLLKNEPRINLLISNAGLMMCPPSKTKDGFELQLGTNHLGHFLFTLMLLPRIIQSKPARIVTVSSMIYTSGVIDFDDLHWEKKKYSPVGAYAQSKLANVLFSKELARRLKAAKVDGVNTYTLHPGVIATDLGRHLNTRIPGFGWLWSKLAGTIVKTPEQGAQTSIYCAVDENSANETGLYYAECRAKNTSSNTEDEEVAQKLWEVSWDLVGLDRNYNPFHAAK